MKIQIWWFEPTREQNKNNQPPINPGPGSPARCSLGLLEFIHETCNVSSTMPCLPPIFLGIVYIYHLKKNMVIFLGGMVYQCFIYIYIPPIYHLYTTYHFYWFTHRKNQCFSTISDQTERWTLEREEVLRSAEDDLAHSEPCFLQCGAPVMWMLV